MKKTVISLVTAGVLAVSSLLSGGCGTAQVHYTRSVHSSEKVCYKGVGTQVDVKEGKWRLGIVAEGAEPKKNKLEEDEKQVPFVGEVGWGGAVKEGRARLAGDVSSRLYLVSLFDDLLRLDVRGGLGLELKSIWLTYDYNIALGGYGTEGEHDLPDLPSFKFDSMFYGLLGANIDILRYISLYGQLNLGLTDDFVMGAGGGIGLRLD